MEIDKSIILTDSVIDELLDDWFERDGETFLKVRKDGRVGWESTLEEGDSYSAHLIEAPTKDDLLKRAYQLATEMLVVMDSPFKIRVKISKGGGGSYTDGKTVCVNTDMFDDEELSVGERLDTFLGVTIHEGCHLLYTDFPKLSTIELSVIKQIFNILEDERIEELCCDHKPGLANFLEKSKYYYFDQYYLDYVVPKEKEGTLSPFDRLMNCLLHIVRYPKYLKEEEIIEFAHRLLEVKKILVPYPETTVATIKAARDIFEIFKDLYEDIERESAKESGSSDSEEDIRSKAMDKLSKDASTAEKSLSKIASGPKTMTGLAEEDLSESVSKDSGLLGEICEGVVEVGSMDDVFFTKAKDSQREYNESISRVKRFVPAIGKVLKGHCKEYKLIHRSMRSGVLDTSKLAEAFQGVPSVYIREGEVKTDKVAVCVLIDESGSMAGDRIVAARDTAILINEAIGHIQGVDLFIYGHSGDMKRPRATEIFVYREKGYAPKFSLGSVTARFQNRDGVAILEVAKRVRKQTKNPVLYFILSDGAPCAGDYSGKSAQLHVKECVTKTEKMGFQVVQVCIHHSYDPGTMFKNYVVMENLSTLALELGKAIKKSTMTTAKVHVT